MQARQKDSHNMSGELVLPLSLRSRRWLGKSSKIIWFSQKNTRRYVAFCETGHVSTLSYLTPGVTCWVLVSVGIEWNLGAQKLRHDHNDMIALCYANFKKYICSCTVRLYKYTTIYSIYIYILHTMFSCLYAHIFSTHQSSPYSFPPSGHLSWVKLGALSNVAMMPNWMVWSLAVLTGCDFGHV